MRYPWPEEKWCNNIHTDSYARSLGYRAALVEGPGIVDTVFSYAEAQKGSRDHVQISWRYAGPLYQGAEVMLTVENTASSRMTRYIICELPRTFPSAARLLMTVEVKAP